MRAPMGCSAAVVLPVDQMLVLSVETARATADALKNCAEEISASGKSALKICRMVSNGLSALATTSNYVEQKTGLSLKQWAGFVNSAGIEMEEYLAQLGKVVDLARRNEAAPAEEIPSEQLQK